MITKDQIEEIRERTDIVDLILEYLPIKKVGKNFRSLCPFHTEKDPSFYVNPEKQIFYCFGCQTGGDAVTFLMKYENLDFRSAVEKLGKRVGVLITRDTTRDRFEELYEANEFASNFYHTMLGKEVGRRGLNYLLNRGVTRATIDKFKLGYAPLTGGLIEAAKRKGYRDQKLIKIGLISAERNWEHLRDRVIFPIFNLGGRIIGFGGRRIDDKVEPKYLNSPESQIFKKGDALFGLFQAKDSIKLKNAALLVEGYFDQNTLFQAGIYNVIAPLGTAFTENQALLLSRFCKRVNLFFDGDMSGIKAALRAIGLLINTQVEVRVVTLPTGIDPDTYVKENGVEAVDGLIETAKDFLDFYRQAKGFKTLEEEIALIKEIAQILGMINDPIRFEKYLKHTSKLFEISEESLKKEIFGKKKEAPTPKSLKSTLELKVFSLAISSPEKFRICKEYLSHEDFDDLELSNFYKTLADKDKFDYATALAVIENEEKKKLLVNLAINEERLSDASFVDVIKNFKFKRMERKIKRLLSEAVKNKDEKAIDEYQKKLLELKKFYL